MTEFLDRIDINLKRKIVYITLALMAASNVFFLKFPILVNNLSREILGKIDVGTVLGIISLTGIWLIYKRKM